MAKATHCRVPAGHAQRREQNLRPGNKSTVKLRAFNFIRFHDDVRHYLRTLLLPYTALYCQLLYSVQLRLLPSFLFAFAGSLYYAYSTMYVYVFRSMCVTVCIRKTHIIVVLCILRPPSHLPVVPFAELFSFYTFSIYLHMARADRCPPRFPRPVYFQLRKVRHFWRRVYLHTRLVLIPDSRAGIFLINCFPRTSSARWRIICHSLCTDIYCFLSPSRRHQSRN